MNMYPNNPGNPLVPFNNLYSWQMPITPPVPSYQPVTVPAPHMEIQRVTGRESAMAYAIGPNSSVVLVDNLAPKIWVVTTDASGFKAVNGFKIVPDDDEQAKTQEAAKEDPLKALSDRIGKLEERMKNYDKPDYRPTEQDKSAYPNVKPSDWDGQGIKGSNGNASANG